MDELKIVKLAELRSRMSGIPVKLILAFLIVAGGMCRFSFDKFRENIPGFIVTFFALYGLLSYFWLFIKLTGNWLIGIVAAFVPFFIWQYNMEKLGEVWNTLIGLIVCFGGTAIDFFTVIRYFALKKQLFSGMAEYGDEEDGGEEYDGAYEEEQRRQAAREWQERSRQQEIPSVGFFNGCKDAASIKRRYRDLCKVYHPDSGNGSPEVFNKITEEYNRLMENA